MNIGDRIIGDRIIEEICMKDLFDMECPEAPGAGCLGIWNGNAAEQLEALVIEWIRPHVDQQTIDKLLEQ